MGEEIYLDANLCIESVPFTFNFIISKRQVKFRIRCVGTVGKAWDYIYCGKLTLNQRYMVFLKKVGVLEYSHEISYYQLDMAIVAVKKN